jgi:hypothetical protein
MQKRELGRKLAKLYGFAQSANLALPAPLFLRFQAENPHAKAEAGATRNAVKPQAQGAPR